MKLPEPYIEKNAKLTYLLIAVIGAVFLVEAYLSFAYGSEFVEGLFFDYGLSLDNILDGKWWTLVTSMFIHAGPDHIIFNLLALFFFSKAVEQEIGALKTGLLFLVSGIFGNVAVLLASLVGIIPAGVPTIGASGAIFGLLGAAMLIKPLEFVFYPYLIPVPLVLVAVIYTLYNIAQFIITLSAPGITDIAYAAHLGGLAVGMLYGFRYEGSKKGILSIILILFILAAIPFIWEFVHYLELTNYLNIFQEAIPRG